MNDVIVVFDIGKTNKKIVLFDKNFEVIYKDTVRFEEVLDDDGFPCDDIDVIENWMRIEVKNIQEKKEFNIKGINFSTHGATLMYLDSNGDRVTSLYNYLKPLDVDFTSFYDKYGGVEEFSRKTASPAYGMLNSGLQMYWLKNYKPHLWSKVKHILHYPQYLSYLFSNKITSDYTSVGAHTAIWDFDKMRYHDWLKKENIRLPEPRTGKNAILCLINGKKIAIGEGLHDSSSSIVPLLEEHENLDLEFILLSTGTWIISMNPFSKEILTGYQLQNNCLCFMTPDKRQIKSSMQFLGKVHEVNSIVLSNYFNVKEEYYLNLALNKKLIYNIFNRGERIFFKEKIRSDLKIDFNNLYKYLSYEEAYYQLIFEITNFVFKGIQNILDKDNQLKDVYISGGFNRNEIFVKFLSLLMPNQSIKLPKRKNASALGAALMMEGYLQ